MTTRDALLALLDPNYQIDKLQTLATDDNDVRRALAKNPNHQIEATVKQAK